MLREIKEKKEWEDLYSRADQTSGKFLQSWDWGEFLASCGWPVRRFAGQMFLAQVAELPLPLGKKYWFCPKGPLMGTSLLGELMDAAKKAGAVFLRIEPPEKSFAFFGAVQTAAKNPPATAIVDISKDEGEILAAMRPKTRYNVRVAEKHAVAVTKCSEPDANRLDALFALFEETAKRDGFRLHPRSYYERQIKLPSVQLFGAQLAGALLAAAVTVKDGDTMTYLHGASSSRMRNVMAPYALHWEIIKEAKAQGCRFYDLWGISDDPKSGWAGITRFKRGWGGEDADFAGTFDLPISPFWYRVYCLARKLRP